MASYFYIHPFRPQYFFPEGHINDPIFQSFYQPYTLKAQISWWLFRNNNLYRYFFKLKDISKHIPEQKIRDILRTRCPMAFNTGTPGREQKITALGREKENYFFIKYAQTPIAKKNVENEYHILKQLKVQEVSIPTVTDFYRDEKQALLKTTILRGERLSSGQLNSTLLQLLTNLSGQKISVIHPIKSDLKCTFGHGDFCPWNMMKQKEHILLFDWEMAGNYPLGYDLFTFIFQTQFLLSPKMSYSEIIHNNIHHIEHYFNTFKTYNWKLYLYEFARIKSELEKGKEGDILHNKYEGLKNYAKEA